MEKSCGNLDRARCIYFNVIKQNKRESVHHPHKFLDAREALGAGAVIARSTERHMVCLYHVIEA